MLFRNLSLLFCELKILIKRPHVERHLNYISDVCQTLTGRHEFKRGDSVCPGLHKLEVRCLVPKNQPNVYDCSVLTERSNCGEPCIRDLCL